MLRRTCPVSRATAATLMKEHDTLALNPKVALYASHRPTSVAREEQKHWKRNIHRAGSTRLGDFSDIKHTTLGARGAVTEARRCLKCADAPCQKGCPTTIDIKQFIQCISSSNHYGAAKIILSDNPVGLSCGHVCPTENLCVGGCNMAGVEGGPINIGGLQAFATSTFRKMNVPQKRSPELPAASDMHPAFSKRVAVIGAGPAGISCATYLARLGYSNIEVFEKRPYAGGLSSSEIPQYRLDSEDVLWEVQQAQDIGVKIHFGKELGKDFTVSSLKNDGFEAVFVGVGLPSAKVAPEFVGLDASHGFFTSKSFLPGVCENSKRGLKEAEANLPDFCGKKVLVLGAGDTAFDCAGSAFRCGANRVLITFRRSLVDMRAVDEEFLAAKEERTEFLPYAQPKRVILNADKTKVTGLELIKMERDEKGNYFPDEDQTFTVKCDVIISAFGSEVEGDLVKAMAPFNPTDKNQFDSSSMQCKSTEWIFGGGDLTGSGITVEAANDGKTAAWTMHQYLQKLGGAPPVEGPPKLPMYHSEIDEVDLTTHFCGIKFPNPFGIASATGATSAAMIARAFEAGWGFAVTKTYSLDKDHVVNVSPRIVRGTTTGEAFGPHQGSFLNIELISEKSANYWISTIPKLKADYPEHVVVASVMSGYVKEDWQELVKMTLEAKPDAIELNLSCPHGMGEKGMGLACGQDEDMVRNICKWVREVCPIPFFAKMTPNITDITKIARAAKEGGADGVTAINTVSGLMGFKSNGEPWPAVGKGRRTTYGGMSGNAARPLALRGVSAIANTLPGFPIMATGGADTADVCAEFLEVGAGVVQICSAVQNQDFTVVQDYIMGLKTHLYMKSRSDLVMWNHQTPPLDPAVAENPNQPPKFGKFQQEVWKKHEASKPKPQLAKSPAPANPERVKVPSVNDLVGTSLKYLSSFTELDSKEQVVAVINEDLCINCGKCYMTCNDSAYQSIEFNAKTHMPRVTENCTGCTLCASVCPIPGCITMVKKPRAHEINRGIPLGEPKVPLE